MRRAHGTSQHANGIILNLLLEQQELLLFAPVADRLDRTGEQDREQDGDGVDPADRGRVEAEEEAGDAEDKEHLHVELIELVPEDGPEGASGGQATFIFSEAEGIKTHSRY